MGNIIAFLGLLGSAIGLVCVIKPIQAIRIRNRKAASVILATSLAVFVIGVQIATNEDPKLLAAKQEREARWAEERRQEEAQKEEAKSRKEAERKQQESKKLAAAEATATVPREVRGTWGANCANPIVNIDENSIMLLVGQPKLNDIVRSEVRGSEITLQYIESGSMSFVTYMVLDRNTIVGTAVGVQGRVIPQNNPPMHRCS